MFDRNTAKSLFLTALRRLSGDPYQMAKILRIQPVAANKSPAPTKSRESLQLDDVDWSGVLNAWIDSNLAADAVRNAAFVNLVVLTSVEQRLVEIHHEQDLTPIWCACCISALKRVAQ